MKLEIGKTYRDGLGDLWTCTDVDWVYSRPYKLHRNRGDLYEYFTQDGQYWTHIKSDKDMVEEVRLNVKLEVGKVYLDRNGDKWWDTEYDDSMCSTYPFHAIKNLHSPESEWFTPDGAYSSWGTDCRDLVGLAYENPFISLEEQNDLLKKRIVELESEVESLKRNVDALENEVDWLRLESAYGME